MMARSRKAPRGDGVAVFVETDDAEIAEREYAKRIEGWAELPEKARQAIVEKTLAQQKKPRPPRMRAGKNDDGALDMGPLEGQTPTLLALELAEAFGGFSLDLANARLVELLKWYFAGEARGTSSDFNAAIAHIHGCSPKTPAEAMLATQMVMTNSAALRALNLADRNLQYPEHAQTLGNLANKLLRTCVAQAEAMAKIQRGGEQVVKHIHLDNRGGQAIVAETVVTGGANSNPGEQSYGTHVTGICAALPGADPQWSTVPVEGGEGKTPVPTARRRKPGRS